jgi:uncharacterized protein
VTVIYLHGFASGVTSSKAIYLGQRLRQRGIRFECPDLNLPEFSTLTVTRMLARTGELIEGADHPVVLMGSSLGGFVAVNAAVKWPDRIAKLVLLAPALDFGGKRMQMMGQTGLDEWKQAGRLNVFHFGYGRMMPVHYELYEDARRYDAHDATLTQPTLVFQGKRDDVVDPGTVVAWAGRQPDVDLNLLDDDHQLGASLGYIWGKIEAFLNPKC